jgi:hypothetical protein
VRRAARDEAEMESSESATGGQAAEARYQWKRATRWRQDRMHHSGCKRNIKRSNSRRGQMHNLLAQLRLHLFPALFRSSSATSPSDASVSSARLRFSSSAPGIQLDQVATFARQITSLLFLLGSCLHLAASRTSTPAAHIRRRSDESAA